MPPLQQLTVCEKEDIFVEELKRLDEQLNALPDDYNSETVYAHYYNRNCDFFVLSWDRENDLLYCFSIINGSCECANKGDQYLTDISSGHANIELDLYWNPKPLSHSLYQRYPEYFPKPI